MADSPSTRRDPPSGAGSSETCEQFVEALHDGLVRYFRSGMHVPAERGVLRQKGDGHCSLEVTFHGKAHLTYVLYASVAGRRVVLQVRSDTIHEQVEVLQSVEGATAENLPEQAQSLYDAIDMDIRRILFTNS